MATIYDFGDFGADLGKVSIPILIDFDRCLIVKNGLFYYLTESP